jgi:hypothetical protein
LPRGRRLILAFVQKHWLILTLPDGDIVSDRGHEERFMSHQTRRSHGRWQVSGASSQQHSPAAWRRDPTEDPIIILSQFDVEAWVDMLAEQRLLIAAAAGVDPSRVTIQVGH